MSAVSLDEELRSELQALTTRNLRRQLRTVRGAQAATIVLDGRPLLNFSSNNYLGLASHPALIEAARSALAAHGTGAGSARLICGNFAAHRDLEAALAQFHRADAALYFSSGYQTNIGVLSALASSEDAIFSDELNHASIIDGCRLSRARVCVYRHRNLEHLTQLLASAPARRRFLVTDTVFSMDGDLAPIPELRRLADRHNAYLIVDEAHATGVLGPGGRGVCAAGHVVPDVHIATLGKAIGAAGAYVVGNPSLIEFLIHRARSFVFTTAAPPAIAAAASSALALVAGAEGERLRASLRANINQFAEGLAALDVPVPSGIDLRSPIFPVLIGDEVRALQATANLMTRGIFAQAIRPPTVPVGTSRLRFTLMATHSAADIDCALDGLRTLRAEGLLP